MGGGGGCFVPLAEGVHDSTRRPRRRGGGFLSPGVRLTLVPSRNSEANTDVSKAITRDEKELSGSTVRPRGPRGALAPGDRAGWVVLLEVLPGSMERRLWLGLLTMQPAIKGLGARVSMTCRTQRDHVCCEWASVLGGVCRNGGAYATFSLPWGPENLEPTGCAASRIRDSVRSPDGHDRPAQARRL